MHIPTYILRIKITYKNYGLTILQTTLWDVTLIRWHINLRLYTRGVVCGSDVNEEMYGGRPILNA